MQALFVHLKEEKVPFTGIGIAIYTNDCYTKRQINLLLSINEMCIAA